MASLVVKAMQQGGVNILMGCLPKSIQKDEKTGRLTVVWLAPGNQKMQDQFDTVVMAAGNLHHCCRFYRAMHFSANARSWHRMSSVCPSVRPSVRLSVTLVICDHIDWKSWKLIARTISPTPSLFVTKMRYI